MALPIALNIDTSAFARCVSRLGQSVAAGTTNPDLRAGAEQGMQQYMGAMRRRFTSASHGDGTWKDLAPSTKEKRLRKAGAKFPRQKGSTAAQRVASLPIPILYDTGKLLSSLVPGEVGNTFEVMTDRVRSGSAVRYAKYHQSGGSRLPQRAILVPPTQEVVQQMMAPVREGLSRVVARATSNG